MMHDALILTNLPNYYKISLFNEIGKKKNIHVVFISRTEQRRNKDFLGVDDIEFFSYSILSQSLNHRSKLLNCLKLFRIIRKNPSAKLILGEWINIEYWFAWLLYKKRNIYMMLESHIDSINGFGTKEAIKKIFLNRVSVVFANGEKHMELARFLGFKGQLLNSKGLGIIRTPPLEHTVRNDAFLYVGRLSGEKNLETLIRAFNRLPYDLTIVGEGPDAERLKQLASRNIHFLGYVNNRELQTAYQSHRALLLVSTYEPFGLVAEEALYFGTPVIASSVCGIVKTLCFHEINSLIVEATSEKQIKDAVERMMDDSFYMRLAKNCNSKEILTKNEQQVRNYVQALSG